MSTTSAIPFLRDFGSTSSGTAEGSDFAACHSDAGDVEDTVFVQKEYERGFDEGRLQAETEFNSQLQAIKEQAARELAEARAAWTSDGASEIKHQVERGFDGLYRDLAKATFAVLEPILEAEVLERTLSQFSEYIQDMAMDPSTRLSFSGPEDLISAVQEKFSGSFDNIDVSIKETPELSVRVDDTTISTNLTKWAQAIGEVSS